MTLLSTASRLNTANQLTAWNKSCEQSMAQAKTSYESIKAQRLAMTTNAEYTAEDIAEVDALLTDLNLKAQELIAA